MQYAMCIQLFNSINPPRLALCMIKTFGLVVRIFPEGRGAAAYLRLVPFCLICISLSETCTCHKAFYKYFCGFGIRKTTKILWLDLQSLKIVSDFQKK